MFCPKCGTKNPENGKFCRSCGTDLNIVSEAISGKLDLHQEQELTDCKGKKVTFEGAMGKLFMGVGFLIVSIALAFSVTGTGWWFWMLIPAFSMLGAGISQVIQIRQKKYKSIASFAENTQNKFDSQANQAELPPVQTDYIKPQTVFDTGEFVERPPSVTEGTTRHLEMNLEGKTMNLRNKGQMKRDK